MSSAPHWRAGEQILWRYRRLLESPVQPYIVLPVTVVRDNAEGLVAWLAPATPVLRTVLPDGRDVRAVSPDESFASGRALRRMRWRGPGVLLVAPVGVQWSVWLFWSSEWEFVEWYVNLEDVHARDRDGIITQDHVLDLEVMADRSVRRKDEDELAAAVRQGRYTAADAARFEATAAAVEEVVARWESPFCDGWEHWRPDPSWPVPSLPTSARWDYDSLDDA